LPGRSARIASKPFSVKAEWGLSTAVVDLRRSRKDAGSPAAAHARKQAKWLPWIAAAALAAAGAVREFSRPQAGAESPLANAKISRLTNFEGIEAEAALSPDGKFPAFRPTGMALSTFGSLKPDPGSSSI
jgi:hypothetical protein